MRYNSQLADPRWQKLRLQIFQAASFACEDCGRRDQELQLHHCAYTRANAWDCDSSLFMCVCDSCHEFRQSREDAIRISIGKITRFLPKDRLESEAWNMVKEMSLRETARLASTFNNEEVINA
jgi:hypothetical protein